MTRPTLPGLVARWRERAGECRAKAAIASNHSDVCDLNRFADHLDKCAAELSQAVALSDAEQEVMRRLAPLPSVAKGFPADAQIALTVDELDTLRALVTRLTAASDGGGKGEGDE